MDDARLRWIALTVAAAMFVHNLDSTLITTSLPQIAATFGLRAVDLSAAISGYVLASAALLPLSAWLADRHGARDVFVLAVALFTLASAGCAVAQNYPQFLVARLLQGAAGALMLPVGRAVVLQRSEGRDLLKAVALITWPALLAPVIAPLLGGVITTYSTWRWNFLLNVPLGAIAIVAALRLLPRAEKHERRSLDVPGMLYLVTGLSGLLYAMDRFAGDTGQGMLTLVALLVGASALLLGLRHLHRSPAPLMDLSAYSVPTFRLSNGGAALVFRASIAATPFLLPLLLQLGYGLNALQAGTFVMAYFVGNLAMKPATNPLLRWFGFRNLLVANTIISTALAAGCGLLTPMTPSVTILLLILVLGFSRSMQFTCIGTMGFADIAPAAMSQATTLTATAQQISLSVGVGVAAQVLNTSMWWRHGDHLQPIDFSVTFWVVGAIAATSALIFARLAPDAGSSVSGHSKRAESH